MNTGSFFRIMDVHGRADQESGLRRGKSWRKSLLVGGLALGLQGGILGLAVLIGVLEVQPPQEARLKVPPGSPTRQREQQQTLEKQLARLNRLQKQGMDRLMEPVLDAARPEIPASRPDLAQSMQAMGAMLPVGTFFQNDLAGLTEGIEADILPPPDPVSFLGETLNAKRIVLLLDVSASVKSKMERAGVSMEKLRQEVHQFVDQLGPNHLFGIIQFTRNWDTFEMELLPATTAVKERAREWINSSFRTTGTSGRGWTRGSPNGIEGVLSAAFAMDAELDEIFLVSDCDFQRTPPGGGGQDVPWPQLRELTRTLQEESIHDTRLRVLCFYPPEDALPLIRAWVRENGPGTLRVF
jgi:hypothetical protein